MHSERSRRFSRRFGSTLRERGESALPDGMTRRTQSETFKLKEERRTKGWGAWGEELADMSVVEFGGEPDEVKLLLTKKFPSQASIVTYWKKVRVCEEQRYVYVQQFVVASLF